MANRYAHIDVDFLHKNTARQLTERLGIGGPLVFLALILAAKNGNPPGTFSYPSEVVGWQRLGLDPTLIPFTLDEFFQATGRCKQTANTRRTHGKQIAITRWADWQKESRRVQAADRKARSRAQNERDIQRDTSVTDSVTESEPRTRTRTTPKPPYNGNHQEPLAHKHACPHCTVTSKSADDLQVHLENVHDYPVIREPDEVTA